MPEENETDRLNEEGAEKALDEYIKDAMCDEVEALIELIPEECRVPVREGGGPEDIHKTLAVSLAKLSKVADERKTALEDIITRADEEIADYRAAHWDATSILRMKAIAMKALGRDLKEM